MTRAGWVVLVALLLVAFVVGMVTANTCWTQAGIGYCGP